LSLAFDAVRIAEVVAAADQRVDPNEAQMIRLIQLMMASPEPEVAESSPKSSADSNGIGKVK